MKTIYDIDDSGIIAGTGQPSVELNSKGGVKGIGKRDAHGCLMLDDEVDTWITVNVTGDDDVEFEYPDCWRLE